MFPALPRTVIYVDWALQRRLRGRRIETKRSSTAQQNQPHAMPIHSLLRNVLLLLLAFFTPSSISAQTPTPQSTLTQLYSGDIIASNASARQLQQDRPDHPIG
jgi:hypothetical protein